MENVIAFRINRGVTNIQHNQSIYIFRFYIKGPRAGDFDVFADNLPGYPDNIKKNSKGSFYVGLASVRFQGASPIGSFLDLVGPYPAVKRFIAKVRLLNKINKCS